MPRLFDWMSSLPVAVRHRVLRLLTCHTHTHIDTDRTATVMRRTFTASSSGGTHVEHLAASWDAAASTYAALWTNGLAPFARSALDATSSASDNSSPSAVPDRRVLDVGCGSGTLSLLAASERRDISHVTAIDYSASMIQSLQRARLQLNVAEQRIQCHVMDAQVRLCSWASQHWKRSDDQLLTAA